MEHREVPNLSLNKHKLVVNHLGNLSSSYKVNEALQNYKLAHLEINF